MKRTDNFTWVLVFMSVVVISALYASMLYIFKQSESKAFAMQARDYTENYKAVAPLNDPSRGETAWGFQVAKAIALAFEDAHAGMITAGELASISKPLFEGDTIPWAELQDIKIVNTEILGSELTTAIANGVKYHPRKNTNFLQIYGLKVLCIKQDKLTKVSYILLDDKPIMPDKKYKIAMTAFMAKGGGPFVGAKSIKVISKPKSLVDELKKRLFPIGRIGKPDAVYFFEKAKSAK